MKTDICTFMIISRSFLLRMRNVSDKSCTENQNTRFVFNNFIFLTSCRFCDNVGKCYRAGEATDDNIIRRMRIAYWIPKATNTHSQYVILIAFPLQQWLQERASILRYTYIACLTLVEFQLDAQNSYLFTNNTFIKILYMFRSLPCSSSGGLRRNCIYAASGYRHCL